MMVPSLVRFAVVVLGDRLVAAAVERGRVQSFVVEAEQPSAALRAELDARKLRPRATAVGLARSAVAVKPIDLPEVGGEVRDMVRFELDRHLPFPSDDAPFDFAPLPAAEPGVAGTARRVLITAADHRIVDGALRIVQEAMLRPVSVTVAAHDLTALVAPPRKQRTVWVHSTGPDADLLFLVGPTLVLSRSVPADDLDGVASEIARSLSVVRWRAPEAIWISGDAVAPDGPTTSQFAQFGVPVIAPPYTPRARRLLAAIDQEPRGAMELAVAVAVGRRGRPLDLIPPALKPRRVTRAQMLTAGMAAAAVVLGIGALLAPGYRDQQRLRALNADITRLEPEVRAVERVAQELDRKKKLIATIDSLELNAIKPLPMMRELTELMPNDAWLTLLSMDTKGVEITGQAASASALIPLLENSPRLERVEFASPVTRGRDREQFRILAKWEAPPGKLDVTPAVATPPPAARAAAPRPPATRQPGATGVGPEALRPSRGAPTPPTEGDSGPDVSTPRRPPAPSSGDVRR